MKTVAGKMFFCLLSLWCAPNMVAQPAALAGGTVPWTYSVSHTTDHQDVWAGGPIDLTGGSISNPAASSTMDVTVWAQTVVDGVCIWTKIATVPPGSLGFDLDSVNNAKRLRVGGASYDPTVTQSPGTRKKASGNGSTSF